MPPPLLVLFMPLSAAIGLVIGWYLAPRAWCSHCGWLLRCQHCGNRPSPTSPLLASPTRRGGR